MAIIKCPECGHQVSEMAPTCPSCGIEIFGKITRCTDCGEIFFTRQGMCPACHCPITPVNQKNPQDIISKQQPQVSVQTAPNSGKDNQNEEPKKKNSLVPLLASFIFALLVCGVCYYFYNEANNKREMEDWEYAMSSNDPMILQSYLDNHQDADPAHRDSIQAHMALILKYDEDWTNAVVSGTRNALEDFLKEHPDSPHKADALNKIDSLDYSTAMKDKTESAYKNYLQLHPDGKYSTEISEALKNILSTQVQPEEYQLVKGVFRKFFQSINSRNEDGVLSTVAETMTSLLNKSNAPKADVVTFMNKLYKDNISNLNWHIIDDAKIDKLPVSDDLCEYNVVFSADLQKDFKDGSTETTRYQITGTVDTEGKISRFLMTRLAE